jgi:hypothetical protein
MPAFGAPSLSRTAGKAVRSAFIYVPNGMTMRDSAGKVEHLSDI